MRLCSANEPAEAEDFMVFVVERSQMKMLGSIRVSLIVVFSLISHIRAQSYGGSSQCPSVSTPMHIRVLAIPGAFFMAANKTAGTQNSGFLVDLLNAIQQQLPGLTYNLTARPDLSYGNQSPSGSWNGSLIGALLNNEADLVGADLTVNDEREAVVDFLTPFSSYELQILFNAEFGLGWGVQYLIQNNAALTYLKNSKNPTLQAIYANIQAGLPDSIVASDAAGLAKVLSVNGYSSYAYIVESPFPDQAIAQNPGRLQQSSSLSRIMGSLGKFDLAMAVQQGSPLRATLNCALLQLAQKGTIRSLLDKYKLFNA